LAGGYISPLWRCHLSFSFQNLTSSLHKRLHLIPLLHFLKFPHVRLFPGSCDVDCPPFCPRFPPAPYLSDVLTWHERLPFLRANPVSRVLTSLFRYAYWILTFEDLAPKQLHSLRWNFAPFPSQFFPSLSPMVLVTGGAKYILFCTVDDRCVILSPPRGSFYFLPFFALAIFSSTPSPFQYVSLSFFLWRVFFL